MTSAFNPVGIKSQNARVDIKEGDKPEVITSKVNDALALIRDDIQRLAGLTQKNSTIIMSGSGSKLPVTTAGVARVFAISDTATASSDGSNYHVLTLLRNGVTPVTMTYDTRNTEIPAYLGGCYIGEVAVGVKDVLSVSVAVTGSPSPSLSTDNFCLLSIIAGAN